MDFADINRMVETLPPPYERLLYGPAQESPCCPFCNARYVSLKEHRPLVVCAVCCGYGQNAAVAEDWVEHELAMIRETVDIDRAEWLAALLYDNYWQFEIRRTLRAEAFIQKRKECQVP